MVTHETPNDDFSRQCNLNQFALAVASAPPAPSLAAWCRNRDIQHPDGLVFCVLVARQTPHGWLPNVNGMSIAYASRPPLRTDSPWVD